MMHYQAELACHDMVLWSRILSGCQCPCNYFWIPVETAIDANSCNAMINSKGIFRDCKGFSVAFSFQYSLCIFAQTGIKLVKKANYPRDLSVLYFSISIHVILHDKKYG